MYNENMNFKEAEKLIKKDGRIECDVVGSHHHYKHPVKEGKVTIPFHGNKELPKFVVTGILKQAQLKE